ncbi:MAG TPA: hypothetical protein VIE64_07045 [Solirubrobacterales bacterium]|jgi:hypothetical protein
MPRLIPFRLGAACALAMFLVISTAAIAVAKGPVADLRVIGSGGKVLADDSFGAATTSIAASPKADCFGSGTGGSGKKLTIKGPTALGMLVQASKFTAALKPVLITDAFDFGLGICGVGKSVATSKLSWYLKVNHKNPELGGESVKVKKGDEVLWALAGFPYPNELSLVAPNKAKAGKPFEVHVFTYDDKGKKKPASGVKVTGGTGLTGNDGGTTVVLNKPTELSAKHGKDIPSNREAVCIGGKCP